MRKWLICLATLGATTSAASAEPVTLADADMDAITAGGFSGLVVDTPAQLWADIGSEAWSLSFEDWLGDLVENLEALGAEAGDRGDAAGSTVAASLLEFLTTIDTEDGGVGRRLTIIDGEIVDAETIEDGGANRTFVVTETLGVGNVVNETTTRTIVVTETVENSSFKRSVTAR